MKYKNIEIRPCDIKCVIPWHRRVMLYPYAEYGMLASNLNHESIKYFIVVDDIDDASMVRFKFEHVKYLKTKANPADRVAEFEYTDDKGLPDFAKMDELIEKRKTRDERQKEIIETQDMIIQYKKHGFKCDFLEEHLRDMLRGGI